MLMVYLRQKVVWLSELSDPETSLKYPDSQIPRSTNKLVENKAKIYICITKYWKSIHHTVSSSNRLNKKWKIEFIFNKELVIRTWLWNITTSCPNIYSLPTKSTLLIPLMDNAVYVYIPSLERNLSAFLNKFPLRTRTINCFLLLFSKVVSNNHFSVNIYSKKLISEYRRLCSLY